MKKILSLILIYCSLSYGAYFPATSLLQDNNLTSVSNPLPFRLSNGTSWMSNLPVTLFDGVFKQLGVPVASTDNGLVTNSVIHGLSSGGGGGYVDVKVTPSGALVTDATISSSALPTGASTEVTLSALNTKVTTTANGVKVDGSAVTQPVSIASTVNVNTGLTQGLTDTQLRASAVPVSQASQPLPTGASTSALQTSGNASLSSIDSKTPALGQAIMASSVPVAIASNQSSLNVNTGLAQGLTDAQLRASAVPVSGTVTANTGLSQPLTDTQLRASAVPVSGSITANIGTTNGVALDASVNSLLKPASTLNAVTTLGSITNAVTIKADTPANQTNALKVDGSATTQPISASSLPLPSGASTEATLASVDSKLPSGLTVTGSRLQVELPAGGGGLTDTELRASPVPVSVSGVATSANQATTNASLSSIDSKTLAFRSNDIPPQDANYLPIRNLPVKKFRTTFAKTIASGVDSAFFNVIATGAGQTVSQSAGNLVLTSGTTANSETILRSTETFKDAFIAKYVATLSQRIANNNFYVELVDVIGDGLALTVNSATSITVTIPSNPFTAENVGQSVYVGNITGVAGAIPARYAIASVSGNNVNFTVAGWPASGTGTVSLFGWNYSQVVYNGVTATNAGYDTQRRGWNTGFTTATINTTASPGHMGVMTVEDGVASYLDQLVATNTGLQTTMRASRVANIPDQTANLYLQIRSLNGSTAPASTTTFTLGMAHVENYASQPVSINQVKPQPFNSTMPVAVLNTPAVTVSSGTVTTVSTVTAVTGAGLNAGALVNDVVSGALTTTTTTASITQGNIQSAEFNIPVTAVSGTTPTLDVGIEESDDSGTNWYRIYDFPRITATGIYRSPLLQLTGNRIRYVQTVAGTTPSFTRAINRVGYQIKGSTSRQLIDRSIVLTTLNSVTPSLNINETNNVQLVINLGTATTPPAIQLEGSDDNGATWYAIGSPLTGVASSTVQVTVSNINARLVRARVSTAGATVTAGYVMIKGF